MYHARLEVNIPASQSSFSRPMMWLVATIACSPLACLRKINARSVVGLISGSPSFFVPRLEETPLGPVLCTAFAPVDMRALDELFALGSGRPFGGISGHQWRQARAVGPFKTVSG